MNIFNKMAAAAAFSAILLTGVCTQKAMATPGVFLVDSDGSASTQDANFLKRAVMSNHAAIDASNIILKKTSNDHLKQIAQTVVDTHTKMLEQLEKAGAAAGVSLPDGSSPMAKAMCGKLEALNGKALDKQFISVMVNLHNAELQMFQAEAKEGSSESLKKLSEDEAPIVKQHLSDLHGIQKSGL